MRHKWKESKYGAKCIQCGLKYRTDERPKKRGRGIKYVTVFIDTRGNELVYDGNSPMPPCKPGKKS